jgi:hypothetical protein
MPDDAPFGDPAADPQHQQLDRLREAAGVSRRIWRWHWQRFWLLRWENALRHPNWRVEQEACAWRRMRAEVRRYAGIRGQLAAYSAAGPGATIRPPDPVAAADEISTAVPASAVRFRNH